MEYYDHIQNKVWKNIYRGIVTIQRFICYACAIILPLIITYQVILRYILKMPLMGIEELMTFFIIWLYMMVDLLHQNREVTLLCDPDIVYQKRKDHGNFQMCEQLFSMIVCTWLTGWAYWFFAYSLKLWKTSDILHIPMFFGESSMFIGLVFMLFFGIIEFIDNVKDAVRICKKGTNEEVKS